MHVYINRNEYIYIYIYIQEREREIDRERNKISICIYIQTNTQGHTHMWTYTINSARYIKNTICGNQIIVALIFEYFLGGSVNCWNVLTLIFCISAIKNHTDIYMVNLKVILINYVKMQASFCSYQRIRNVHGYICNNRTKGKLNKVLNYRVIALGYTKQI